MTSISLDMSMAVRHMVPSSTRGLFAHCLSEKAGETHLVETPMSKAYCGHRRYSLRLAMPLA